MTNEQLRHAIDMIEDAVIQGRGLVIKFYVFEDEFSDNPVVDVVVNEDDQHLFSDVGLETFEQALIELAGELEND